MPSFSTVVSALLLPAGAVLAGSLIPVEPILRREPCKTTYLSQKGDTCATMDKKFGLSDGAILAANTFLTCSDVWVNTPICVPDGGSTPATPTPAKCQSTYNSLSGDTCDSLEKAHNLASGAIKGANSFVTCNDIWPGTPLCIPDGVIANDIGCTIQTYYSQSGDTCESIQSKFALPSGDVKEDNPFVTCNDIWAGTPLVLCVPKQAEQGCTQTVNSLECETCDDIGAAHGVSGEQIKAWNSFLDCNDIWTNTPVCVKH